MYFDDDDDDHHHFFVFDSFRYAHVCLFKFNFFFTFFSYTCWWSRFKWIRSGRLLCVCVCFLLMIRFWFQCREFFFYYKCLDFFVHYNNSCWWSKQNTYKIHWIINWSIDFNFLNSFLVVKKGWSGLVWWWQQWNIDARNRARMFRFKSNNYRTQYDSRWSGNIFFNFFYSHILMMMIKFNLIVF